MQYADLGDTVYFWFASNDTDGSGDDGATPLADVRLAGAAADAAPVYSPTPVLLTAVGYTPGCHELAVAATAGNGFAANGVYAVFCSLTVDSQNPSGFVGNFQLQRQQVDAGISSGTAAISTTAVAAPNGFVITTGSNEGNDEDSTHALDGVYHTLEDTGGTTDAYYIFSVGGNGVPVTVSWWGYAQSKGDTWKFYAYNWSTSAWEQVGERDGKDDTKLKDQTFDLTNAHVGTGANLGKVHFRFASADGTLFATDRILCSYSVVGSSVGYALGAVWVNTVDGVEGTEVDVNGVADNPSKLWADALIIGAAKKLDKYVIANGSTVKLTAACETKTLLGSEWILELEAQSISGTYVEGAHISGVSSGASHVMIVNSNIGAATMPPGHYLRCGFGDDDGTFTAASDGEYAFVDCFSLVPGSGIPAFVWTGLGATTGVNSRRWSGGAAHTLDSDVTLSQDVVSGGAQTFDLTAGGDIELRGFCRDVTITAIAAGSTVQLDCIMGTVTITGTGGIVNVSGVVGSIADTTSPAATVTNDAISAETALTKTTWTDVLAGYLDKAISSRSSHDAAAVVTALGTGSTLTDCLTAAGFSTHDAAAVVTALGTGSTLTDCLTAAGFSTHDADAVKTAVWAQVIDVLTAEELLRLVLSVVAGDFSKSGNVYTFKRQDGATTEVTLTITSAGRTAS